jgi:hypothetical protein
MSGILIYDARGAPRAIIQTVAKESLTRLLTELTERGLKPRVWAGDRLRFVPIFVRGDQVGYGLPIEPPAQDGAP